MLVVVSVLELVQLVVLDLANLDALCHAVILALEIVDQTAILHAVVVVQKLVDHRAPKAALLAVLGVPVVLVLVVQDAQVIATALAAERADLVVLLRVVRLVQEDVDPLVADHVDQIAQLHADQDVLVDVAQDVLLRVEQHVLQNAQDAQELVHQIAHRLVDLVVLVAGNVQDAYQAAKAHV